MEPSGHIAKGKLSSRRVGIRPWQAVHSDDDENAKIRLMPRREMNDWRIMSKAAIASDVGGPTAARHPIGEERSLIGVVSSGRDG